MQNTEPIEIVDYDPTWPLSFDQERNRLTSLLAPWLVADIEHIGSTAVPGLMAKPVIDIMAPVASLQVSANLAGLLSDLEYCYFPYKADVMHWFCKPSPQLRTHHLHLVPIESALWKERLSFRDALRANPKLTEEYAVLKCELAKRYRFDRDAYTEAKSGFIQRVLNAPCRY